MGVAPERAPAAEPRAAGPAGELPGVGGGVARAERRPAVVAGAVRGQGVGAACAAARGERGERGRLRVVPRQQRALLLARPERRVPELDQGRRLPVHAAGAVPGAAAEPLRRDLRLRAAPAGAEQRRDGL